MTLRERIDLARQAGDRHQSAHALCYLIKARPFRIWSILSKTRYAGINQFWIFLTKGIVIYSKTLLHIWTIIFDNHIRSFD